MDWRERIRNLWVERMVWTRHYIISLMMGLRDLSFVATRALRNGAEFGQVLAGLYGTHIGVRFENAFTQHVLILSELASTARTGADISVLEPAWTANAESMIGLLLEMNPNWVHEEWRTIIYDQFRIEVELIHQLKQDRYAEGIEQFDRAHDNALRIARKMVEEIELQFSQMNMV
ncbi:MAG TPA: hypothetical protein VN366_08770 [Feifaniaceae bacterium]|nr:hypothetical protein [Feifaniaceae bacterium]